MHPTLKIVLFVLAMIVGFFVNWKFREQRSQWSSKGKKKLGAQLGGHMGRGFKKRISKWLGGEED